MAWQSAPSLPLYGDGKGDNEESDDGWCLFFLAIGAHLFQFLRPSLSLPTLPSPPFPCPRSHFSKQASSTFAPLLTADFVGQLAELLIAHVVGEVRAEKLK